MQNRKAKPSGTFTATPASIAESLADGGDSGLQFFGCDVLPTERFVFSFVGHRVERPPPVLAFFLKIGKPPILRFPASKTYGKGEYNQSCALRFCAHDRALLIGIAE